MKKEYTTPVIEKIAFNYRDQVVAASSTETPEVPGTGGGGQPHSGVWSGLCYVSALFDLNWYVETCRR